MGYRSYGKRPSDAGAVPRAFSGRIANVLGAKYTYKEQ